ncbi:unnamed protein product [marine sediment metagenome]|uniref:Uncharacterized protein n=1 Tax=marine sediment metagenome TaxID=412755 RepID=X1NKQ5_9ZZZZ
MGSSSFDKEVDKIVTSQVNNIDIREDSYKPDENKFSDYLKFCKLYPRGDYIQFRRYCQEKNKEEVKK